MAIFIRMALYTLAFVIAAVGLGDFDIATGRLTMDLNQIATAIASAGIVNALVLKLWGKT